MQWEEATQWPWRVPVKLTTRTRSPQENLGAKCAVRLPLQTRQLFARLVVVKRHDCLTAVCRRYIAHDLRVDGVDPAALGLVDAI